MSPFCAFLGHSGYFLVRDQVQNTFSEPTKVDYQFLFWKCSPIFLFLIWPNLGLFFLHVLGPLGLFFGVGVTLKDFFGTCLSRQSTSVLEVQTYIFVFELAQFGAYFFTFFGGPFGTSGLFLRLNQVQNYFWDLLVYMNNFAFGQKVQISPESTILDGWLAGSI